MQIVEPEHRSGRNKYKDHKEREYFSLGMTKRTSVLGAVARTQEEGREVAGDQSDRAFGHGDDHGL